MIIKEEEYLAHYGILRRSGRYPWGSGGPEKASNKGFIDMVDGLRKQGMSEVEIARGMGISTTQLRAAKSVAKNEEKQREINQAQQLRDKGYSNVAIGQKMGGKNESSVRALLAEGAKDKADVLQATAGMLKSQVGEKKYIDVGAGVETQLNVSKQKLDNAVAVLREEGYTVHYLPVRQLGTGKDTNLKVLAAPDVTYSEVLRNRDSITQITNFSDDGGRSYLGLHPPVAIHPDRIGIKYAEDGGAKADGVIYVRPGVPDVSLGNSNYAQVRIKVGKGHYLKGMAMYKDDLPAGVDLQFNTNKKNTGNKLDAMKSLKKNPDGTIDKDNPFGATIESQVGFRRSDPDRIVRQLVTRNPDGTEKVTSAMNIVNAEGNWGEWSKSLSAQMLSKQNPSLAKAQLDKTFADRTREYKEISSLTNPTVRKKLLETFGDSTDSAAVHLRAAALPRQISHVILPITSMKETEVYAPNYHDGERVVLVRYPHGGKFEIPELMVNNNQPEAKRLLRDAKDAIGIHPKVAERLSGADFDGDAVLVIPNNSGKVKTAPPLSGLKDFDPQREYPHYEGMKKMTPRVKGIEMGNVTNLITDMSLQQASSSEMARAIRHSMVVIDAEKHNLNWKLSAEKNGIPQLKEKYQGKKNAGASTLISRATSDVRVPERKDRSAAKGGPIDKNTGKREYEYSGKTYVNAKGQTILKTTKSQKLAETDDAHTLSSGTVMEKIYADHANRLKDLANQARRESVNTPRAKYSPSARQTYSKEVASLNASLAIAHRNKPLERQAQILANAVVKQKLDANPDMDDDSKKKVQFQALTEARNRTGAGKARIRVTDSEWEAIQAGAISDSRLGEILRYADIDVIKAHATPRQKRLMSPSNTARAKRLLAGGATRAEVAAQLGVSLSTLDVATSGEEGG